jgi:signal transduction histidine kinase
LRAEIEGLRASRKQLVLAADADRRSIERDLHDGVHQHFVSLAVNLQLLGQVVESDPAAAGRLVDEMGGDVQRGLEQSALLAKRIYPAMLAQDGLAVLLRSAAVDAGVPASVEVRARTDCPLEVGMTVYLAWLAALARASPETRPAISVRDGDGALAFEVIADAAGSDDDLDRVRERVEALGGHLTITTEQQALLRATGSLPLS